MRFIICFIAAFSVAAGIFLLRSPAKVIDLQRRFYAMINWRMEPIDMARELRNTRRMGVSVIICVAAALLYAFMQGLFK